MKRHKPIQIGETFTRWTVVALSSKIILYNRHVICDCSCGTKGKEVRESNLRHKRSQSCGCLGKENSIKTCRLAPGESSYNNFENNYKYGAKVRGYSYSLTKEEFRKLVSSKCHYCGSEGRLYNRCKYPSKDNSAEWIAQNWIKVNGIDRKDNNIGYEINNCVASCEECNLAKRDHSYNEFNKYIDRLVNYRKSNG
jgi:hypothetical protein